MLGVRGVGPVGKVKGVRGWGPERVGRGLGREGKEGREGWVEATVG